MQLQDYMSFLVRLWRDHPGTTEPCSWRGEIEQVQTGTHWRFSRHSELLAFLHELTGAPQAITQWEEFSKGANTMSRIKAQALLDELQQYVEALILADKPEPIERVSGAVDGGPALLVENLSAAQRSIGIEVQVSQEDAEVRNFALSATANQHAGIGVIGRGDYGVVGQSPDNVGVMGFGTTGVFGFSNDPAGRGIEGHTTSPSGIGVLASAPAPEITALAIDTGTIRVLGAGEQTPTPVFVHVAGELNTRGNQTVIDHPMTNNDPHAILFITQRETLFFNQNNDQLTPSPQAQSFSVAYSSRAAKWLIIETNGSSMPQGAAFNVLVFKA